MELHDIKDMVLLGDRWIPPPPSSNSNEPQRKSFVRVSVISNHEDDRKILEQYPVNAEQNDEDQNIVDDINEIEHKMKNSKKKQTITNYKGS